MLVYIAVFLGDSMGDKKACSRRVAEKCKNNSDSGPLQSNLLSQAVVATQKVELGVMM